MSALELVARHGGDSVDVNGDMKTGARWALDNKMRPALEQIWLERGTSLDTIKRVRA